MRPASQKQLTQHSRTAGFSTIEVLVVLGVMALALALVAPNLRGPSPQAILAGQARKLVGLLVEARGTALVTGRVVVCEVDVEARKVTAQPPVRLLQLPGSLKVSITVDGQGSVVGSRAQIYFHPDGSASAARIVLGAAGHATTIAIDTMTGDVSMSAGDR